MNCYRCPNSKTVRTATILKTFLPKNFLWGNIESSRVILTLLEVILNLLEVILNLLEVILNLLEAILNLLEVILNLL